MTFLRLEIEFHKGPFYRKGDRLFSVVGVGDIAEAKKELASLIRSGSKVKSAQVRDWDADMNWVRNPGAGERPTATPISI